MKPAPLFTSLALAGSLLAASASAQQPGTVKSWSKIGSGIGGFKGTLQFNDSFGLDLAAVGDINGDGVNDLAVGNSGDDGSSSTLTDDFGAVWLLFLNPDGSVKGHQKIGRDEGGFTAPLKRSDWFGYGVEPAGDLDGDGTFDLWIGAGGDDQAGFGHGALYTLFMNPDGSVREHVKQVDGLDFPAEVDNLDHLGFSVARLEDMDGDGVAEAVVGAVFDDDGGFTAGAFYLHFMNADGTIKSTTKVSTLTGGVVPELGALDEFGRALANAGDVDGDGLDDLIVGAFGDPTGGPLAGAAYLLFMNADGTVRNFVKYGPGLGGFSGTINPQDRFGASVAGVGDLNADGTVDIAVGASRGPFFALGEQSIYILFLRPDGTVKSHTKITTGLSGFDGELTDGDRFGSSIHSMGDLDGDGVVELAVGANGDDEGGLERGAVWMLRMHGAKTANWKSLHGGLRGSAGKPLLVGEGALQGGDAGTLRVSGALPGGTLTLVGGFGQLNAPFKGGVMVPTPDVLLSGFSVGPSGRLVVPFTWPADFPRGFELVLQFWGADPGAELGFAASNGMLLTQP
ncbi:MAG: hypothetical protein DHS20C15_12570 [Planctomycetota bacterium]|nr:MAG: hypothetical protein DHS20C15_12570 [Planctomycetota bacterium]